MAALASALFLVLYWPALTAWFRADDFAWLGVGLDVHNFHDFLSALFSPKAQGTIRPWSERAFFMAGYALFGLDALPFHIVVFVTQFANLVLVGSIGARMTERRPGGLRHDAGLYAAILWLLNSSLILPLGWVATYNQVMCGFFLLLALHLLMRYTETGRTRYLVWQWIVFLLGFGALELNLVYPAIAAAYTWFYARKYFRRTLPMFAVSAAYALVHFAVAPPRSDYYAMHFTGAMLRTLAKYWTWSIGPTFLETPLHLPRWVLPAGIAIVSLALLAFVVRKLRAGQRGVLFCLVWYLATLAPVLPLRDHITEYYVYLPVVGLAWLGGWALAESRVAAPAIALLYAFLVVPETIASTAWNHRVSTRARDLVEGVAQAHELHPTKSILLEGVDTDLFWNAILDRPFRLIGLDHVYLTPGSERRIEAHPALGNVAEYVLPAGAVDNALKGDAVVVYDVRGPRLRNITSVYAALPRETKLPLRVDLASPLTQYLLGPEWYPADGDHRWMPRRATLRMAGPAAGGQKLYLEGQCPREQLRQGPLTLTVTVEGAPPARNEIREPVFHLAFTIPYTAVGKPEMQIALEVSRVFRPADDPRDLGVVFGVIEVR